MITDEKRKATMQYLHEISVSLKNGHAAVMVGAGFSKNAECNQVSHKSFPTWNQLADVFYEKLHGISHDQISNDVRYISPLVLAEEVEAAYGRPVLDRILIESIPDMDYRPSPLHIKILQLPWVDVFTTNYDTLLERTCDFITAKRFNIVKCKEDLVNSANFPRIVKLHGTFPSHRPFVITREDYRCYPKKSAPFVNTVQQSLLENTLCLIGFSGEDENFRQWIGWIHDNLGKDNSSRIYLITYGGLPNAQEKLLYEKNVVVVDISFLNEKKDFKDCLEALLDFLLEAEKEKREIPRWPDHIRGNANESNNIDQFIGFLREQRQSYPGWMVAPYFSREKAQSNLRTMEFAKNGLKKNPHQLELEFLFEYDWLREICLEPLFRNDIVTYELVIERHRFQESADEKDNLYYQTILLALYRAYRENDYHVKRKELNDRIKKVQWLTDDLRHLFNYENCMNSLVYLEYDELKKLLISWEVAKQSPEWILRKAGLLSEIGELSQARNLLMGTLSQVRTQLQFNTDDCKLLSQENIIMSLLRFCEQANNYELLRNKKEEDNPLLDDYAERNSVHRKYNADCFMEIERFELMLKTPANPLKNTTACSTFEFGKQTVTTTMGTDSDTLNAFMFLRFFETTGLPFRIKNVTIATKAIEGAVERIAQYNSSWAVIISLRSNNDKSINTIYSRSSLANSDYIEIDELSRNYIKIMKRMEKELNPNDWFFPQHIAGFCACIIPEILSRLCCKCSLMMQDEILNFLLNIYKSNCRNNYKNVNNLTKMIMKAYTFSQIIERFTILADFPLIQSDTRYAREYPDPFLYIPLEKVEFKFDTEKYVEILLEKVNEPDFHVSALERLVILNSIGFLSVKQIEIFNKILWKDFSLQNPRLLCLRNVNRILLLDLPHPSEIDINLYFKQDIFKRLRNFVDASGVSSGNNILEDLDNFIERDLFNNEELEELIEFCFAMWDKYKNYLDFSFANSRDDAFKVSRVIAHLIMHGNALQNNSIMMRMEQVCSEMKAENLLHLATEIFWRTFKLSSEPLLDLINQYLIRGNEYQKISAYEIIGLSQNYIEKLGLLKLLPKLLDYISQQIFWRVSGNLTSALNTVSNSIRKNEIDLIEPILVNVLFGLESLVSETLISQDDTIEVASEKGSLRISAARLAATLHKFYYADKHNQPDVIKRWQEICNDSNEFVEIRKQWNLVCDE